MSEEYPIYPCCFQPASSACETVVGWSQTNDLQKLEDFPLFSETLSSADDELFSDGH